MGGSHEKSRTMTFYRYVFSRRGEENFLTLPRVIQVQIKKKLEFYLNSGVPLRFAKRLTGYDNCYRFRVGAYRVVFSPEQEGTFVLLLILKVGLRAEIYE